MIIHSSEAMLDAVFAEVQQVFHQSLEFPLALAITLGQICYLFLLSILCVYVHIYTATLYRFL